MSPVLIETLWNVNHIGKVECTEAVAVLIETLWNVNLTSTGYVRREIKRINRNIVECKYGTVYSSDCSINGINRNIVECKLLTCFSSIV